MNLKSINPATQTLIQEYSAHPAELVDAALATLWSSYQKTRNPKDYPHTLRKKILNRLADLLETRVEECARMITLEMGKTLNASRQEVKKCALACRHYAENLDSMLAPTDQGQVHYQPIGVILAVMPWNFPFWQILRVAAPQIALGNPILLKHASNVSGCAALIEELVSQASPEIPLLKHIRIPGAEVERWIADPRIQGVTLTGSEKAGASVARAAGEHLKKTVLELGGSDPFLVSTSSDVQQAAQNAAKARLINAGQSCIAAKRLIVVEPIWEAFIQELKALLLQVKQGPPDRDDTELGPLQSRAAAKELEAQVKRALERGCVSLFEIPLPAGLPQDGAYAKIQLLDATRSDFQEELFGPVALLYRARDWQHAIQIANQSPFGLSSSIWTQDAQEKETAIALLEAGCVYTNTISASDPKLPFGGIKRSGYGRELGWMGIREFANVKTCVGNL